MTAVKRDLRVAALQRFAIALSVLTILGHTVLGFEAAYAYPIVSLATTYSLEILLELVDAWAHHRRPAFLGGGFKKLVEFLLPAHITGLAVAMLVYSGAHLVPIAYGAAVATASKYVFRIPGANGQGSRHFFNPSNTGISSALLTFPGFVIPGPGYQFTENFEGAGDWLLPCVIILVGSTLNTLFTKRIPLILGWLAAYVAQGLIRWAFFDFRLAAVMAPMTGMAFLLFTFYMVSDPGTTPSDKRNQVIFGAAVALVYGVLNILNITFGIFLALTMVCGTRGLWIWIEHRFLKPATTAASAGALAGAAASLAGAQPGAGTPATLPPFEAPSTAAAVPVAVPVPDSRPVRPGSRN